MKSYLFTFLAATAVVFLHAQDNIVITGTKKITKKLTPQQVIDSINRRFPDAKSIQYFKASPAAVKKGWEITEDDNLPSGEDVDYYTVSFKRDDLDYYGLYDKTGTLLNSRVQEKVDKLPDPIRNSLKSFSKDHPGYKVTSKGYYRNQNHAKVKEYYEVVATNGKSKKRLFYSADGTLVKVKG